MLRGPWRGDLMPPGWKARWPPAGLPEPASRSGRWRYRGKALGGVQRSRPHLRFGTLTMSQCALRQMGDDPRTEVGEPQQSRWLVPNKL